MKNTLPWLFLILLMGGCRKEKTLGPAGQTADYLTDRHYRKLIVEVVFTAGNHPEPGTMSALSAFLQRHIHKPAGIEVVEREISLQESEIYTFEEIRQLERANRSLYAGDGVLTSYVFFANGDYEKNTSRSKVLGIAYGLSSVVIFKKTIRDHTGGLFRPPASTVEKAVLHHEFGHLLGLVNNGTSMHVSHEDEDHPKHCRNRGCLMYYAAETSEILGAISGNTVPELDEDCVNDLRRAGGK